MLSDRPYMRDPYNRPGTGVLAWLLGAIVAVFVVQNVSAVFLQTNAFERLFALTPGGLRHGFVWTLLTYAFLHGGVLHLLFNVLFLYLLGRELLPLLGLPRLLAVCGAAAAAGGLFWFATHWAGGNMALVGASGMVLALFIIFACFYAEREVTFLLFFVLPVTVKPKVVAWVLAGVEGLGFLFSELPGGRYDTGIAYSAHLGGMLTGWLYFRHMHDRPGWTRFFAIALPGWLRRRKAASGTAPRYNYKVNVSPKAKDLRSEVDRVLDKINSQGFGALTAAEKRVLDEAKDLLSRR